ncbi:aminotransferase class I/II-fold pyridoxal phosphate-dependent enzyme [Polyangium sp. y55x31]|uniref:trans-sulfuration enzyme family protein n=1 Tax=Polyangium sp. y55x31 TaxID=3042688 RepID=UPI00248320A7|nr:aminotransferase class I/II-fold pyridoxal phosphate-dependent enzyme [Polyangium sp. y55x31]MDI1478441.1 aminotransferase class I/II-fold pyridoxal phosphate-dependent enzyme [Polyangium sp. y55x31]
MRHDSTGRMFARESIAAQALGWVDEETRAIVAPIHPSTTFLRDPDNQYRSGRVYGRSDNPTFDQAEALVTSLEGGSQSMLFASGMAAATAVFLSLSPGDHVVVPEVMYWSLRSWICGPGARFGLRVSLVDMTSPEKVAAAMEPGKTRLVWVETPANPLWGVTDIAEVSRIAHAAGALVCVDSTSATPVLTRPLEWGADFVMHSATKYLNGHSDVLAGTLTAARACDFWERVRATRWQVGSIAGAFEAWLLVRGMRTLFLRVRAASQSALAVAEYLERHPRVLSVMYPGLSSFPTHAVAARQMDGGFGGMLSVRIRGGEEAAVRVASRVSLWKRATSLGGVESLIEHRASVEGQGSPVPKDLLRLSVGIEAAPDLIADLDQALAF